MRVFKYFNNTSFIGFVIILFSHEILLFFAPNYLNIINLIPVLLPTIILTGCSYFVGLGIHIHKKSKLFLISSFIALVINTVSSYFFAIEFGLIGIAYGSLLSSLIWILIEQYFNFKLINLKLKLHYLIYIIFAFLALGKLTNQIDNIEFDLLFRILLKSILACLIFTLIVLINREIRTYLSVLKTKYFN